MGGLCSRSSSLGFAAATTEVHGGVFDKSFYKSPNGVESDQMRRGSAEEEEEKKKKQQLVREEGVKHDDFYDGIPVYTGGSGGGGPMSQKSRSVRSTQAAVAKVSEVSSRLGRAGTAGLGKAVDVLDTLGSSMTSLNAGSGFITGATTKGNEISILAFEVANTIVKASNLMQSLSKRSTRHLKEVILPSDGVQHLVSKDMDELLQIVAADKREELKIFSGEVVRFGNRSKDPQWHNLDRYFEKISRELTPQKQLKEEAELVMQQLMSLVQITAELYHELHALDRFDQDYQRKRQEDDNSIATQRGDSLTIMRAELKSQKKQVKNLKKKSLWSRSLEEVMEKLVDIVHFLHLEIHNVFGIAGPADGYKPVGGPLSHHQRLGPAGLSLHYANIVIQIDTLVARSSSMPPSTRDALYQSLPPNIRSAIRSKLQSFHVKEELTVIDIKDEMEKTLQWLVPIATNTAKAHHGFGWVGEWANTGSEANRKPTVQTDVVRIETFHHADKEKTEAYILELVLWLHHLVNRSKSGTNGGVGKSSDKSPTGKTLPSTNQQPKQNAESPVLTIEDQEMLQNISNKKGTRGISKSQDFEYGKAKLIMHSRLSRSYSQSSTREGKDLLPLSRLSSGIPVIDFGIDKAKALDVIDRVDSLR